MSAVTAVTEAWTDHTFTVSDGTKLHYVEMGRGTPVILIHGAGGSAVGNWFANGIAPRLAKTNRVIGIDMRAHGLSEDGPPGGRGKMADDVIEFMDAQGIKTAHIGGYSMGGGVTLTLLVQHPERFITASFHGSGVGETAEWRDRVPADKEGGDPEAKAARDAYQASRAARGEAVGNGASVIRGEPEASEAEQRARMEAMAKRREALLESLDLTKIKFPIMTINGEFDRPLAKSHRLWRECDDFTNLVLPGKGHLSAVMKGFIPDAYIDGMAAFITRNNPR
ncbi:MAG TPA: alpha/beta hydrolase [Caulobacteraceae bacterium]|nr:alpha/beta hydrolase [Caulobacteraceae bacterium]